MVNKKTVLKNEIFAIEEEKYKNSNFYRLICPDWVNVIPLTKEGDVVFVVQYRFGIKKNTLEIPGGQMDLRDKDPREAAKRELLEETGYFGKSWEYLGYVHPNPAIINNKCHTFLVKNVKKVAEIKNDANEETEVFLKPLKEVPKLILNKKITHSLVLNAFHLFFLKNNI